MFGRPGQGRFLVSFLGGSLGFWIEPQQSFSAFGLQVDQQGTPTTSIVKVAKKTSKMEGTTSKVVSYLRAKASYIVF